MSRLPDASGPNPSRKNDRRQRDARRRDSIGLFGAPKAAGAPGWAVVERLEERTLMAQGFTVSQGGPFTGGTAVPLLASNGVMLTDTSSATPITGVTIAETTDASSFDSTETLSANTTSNAIPKLPITVSQMYNASTHTLTLSPKFPLTGVSTADMMQALQSVVYLDSSMNLNSQAVRTFTYTASDASGPFTATPPTTTLAFNIAAPVVTLSGVKAVTYDGTAPVQVFDNSATFSSVNNLSQVAVTIDNIQDAGSEVLFVPSGLPNNIVATTSPTGTTNTATSNLTGGSTIYLNASGTGATLANMETALQAIRYFDNSTSLTQGAGTDRSFTVTATDAGTPKASSVATAGGLVTFAIAAPVLTLPATTTIAYPGKSVSVVPAATMITSANNIVSATITLNALVDPAGDESFAALPGFPASGFTIATKTTGGGKLVMTLTATNPDDSTNTAGVDKDVFLAALKLVGYSDSASVPSSTARMFSIQVTDTGNPAKMSTPVMTSVDLESSINIVPDDPTPSPVLTGQAETFHFLITNNGTSPAYQLSVTDLFSLTDSNNASSPVKFLGLSSADAVVSTTTAVNAMVNTVVITFASPLAPNASANVSVMVAPPVAGMGFQSTLTPNLETGELNKNSGNSPFKTNAVSVAPVANLTVTAGAATLLNGDTSFRAGHAVQYSVTVSNASGASKATGVTLTDVFTLDGNSANVTVNSVTGNPTTPFTLNPGASQTFTFNVTPKIDGQLVNTASVTLNEKNGNSVTSVASPATTILPETTLNVTNAQMTGNSLAVNTPQTFVVAVANMKPSAAYGLSLSDVFSLPLGGAFNVTESDGVDFLSGTAINTATNTVTLTFGNPLPANETATVDITIMPTMSGTLTSTATATVIGTESLVENAPNTTIATATATIHDSGTISLGGFSPSSLTRSSLGQNQTATINANRSPNSAGDSLGTASAILNFVDTNGQLVDGVDYTVSVNGSIVTSGSKISFPAGSSTDSAATIIPITFTLLGSNTFKGQNSNIQFSLTDYSSSPTGTVVNTAPQDLPIGNTQQFVVTNNQDYRPGVDPIIANSLRQIIAQAEAFETANHLAVVGITFDIPGTIAPNYIPTQSDLTIKLLEPIDITNEVLIDGGSEPVPKGASLFISIANGGDAGDGILFDTGSDNSAIQNVNVSGFNGNGIEVFGNNVTIRSSTITGNTGDGVKIEGNSDTVGDANVGLGNSITGNQGYGVEVVGTVLLNPTATPPIGPNNIENNTIGGTAPGAANSMGGILIDQTGTATAGTVYNLVRSNSLTDNANFGIEVSGSPDASIRSNTISGTAGVGIVLTGGSSDAQVITNSITGSLPTGISIDGGSYDSVTQNTVGGTTVSAIALSGSITGDTLASNSISDSSGTGISLSGTIGGTLLDSNTIGGKAGSATGTGLSLTGTITGTILTSNTISLSGNSAAGISLSDVSGSGSGSAATPDVTIIANSINAATSGTLGIGLVLSTVTGFVSATNDTISGTSTDGILVDTSHGTMTGTPAMNVTGVSIIGASITATSGTGIKSVGDNGISIATSSIGGTLATGIAVSGVAALPVSLVGDTISGTSVAGITVTSSGTTSKVALTNIGVTAAIGEGIVITGGSSETISQTTVSTAASPATPTTVGISIDGASNVSITGTNVSVTGTSGALTTGVYFSSVAGGTISGSTISGNLGTGVSLVGGTKLGVVGTSINGQGVGVSIDGDDGVTIDSDVIKDTTSDAVSVSTLTGTTSKVAITGTTIIAGNGDGILLAGGASTMVANDAIAGTLNRGILVTGGSDNSINGTTISTSMPGSSVPGSLAVGILIDGGSSTIGVGGSTVTGASVDGILVLATPAAVTISRNQINTSGYSGVEVDAVTGVVIASNRITGGTAGDGVRLYGALNAQLTSNDIEKNSGDGVGSTGNVTVSSLSLSNNTISGNTTNGVSVDGHDQLLLMATGNTIDSNAGLGIHVENTPGAFIQSNFIGTDRLGTTGVGNAMGGVSLDGSSGAKILENAISGNGNQQAGLVATNSSYLSIEGNYVGLGPNGGTPLPNGGGGIMVTDPDGSVIDNNKISSNNLFGLDVEFADGTKKAGVVISNNDVGTDASGRLARGNAGPGIEVDDAPNVTIAGSSVAITGNILSANTGAGLLASGTSILDISDNIVGGSSSVGGTLPLGNGMDGILLTGTANATVTANVLVGNLDAGLAINGTADSNTSVTLNYIGTDANATSGLGNQGDGIHVYLTGGVSISGNLIASNRLAGIEDSGSRLSVMGNSIGTAIGPDGKEVVGNLGNLGSGIYVGDVAMNSAVTGVTITDNQIGGNGLQGIDASNTSGLAITGNSIGFAEAPGEPVLQAGNMGDGIRIGGSASTTVTSNFIGFNGQNGVEVDAGSSGIALTSNQIGRFPASGTLSGNVADGVLIMGAIATSTVTLSSNDLSQNGGDGLGISDSSGVAFGAAANTISNNSRDGIDLEKYSTANSLVGETGALNQETISSNQGYGVHLQTMATGNTLSNLIIGSNSQDGIRIELGANYNTISGGSIDGNHGSGVAIFSTDTDITLKTGPISDKVQANVVTGVSSIAGNDDNGILIQGRGAMNNTLQGNSAGEANENDGVAILGAGGGNQALYNTIDGNNNAGLYIAGTGSTTVGGNTVFGNNSNGVVVTGGGAANTITGNTSSNNKLAGVLVLTSNNNTVVGNTIVANSTDGVDIFGMSQGNSVAGNYIGTDASNDVTIKTMTGPLVLGNKGDGVHIVDSPSNVIGGLGAQDGNVISANQQSGVEIFGNGSTGNAILGNVIGTATSNSNLGNKLDGVLIAGAEATAGQVAVDPKNNDIGAIPGGQANPNVIAGNQNNGIAVIGADSNSIQDNLVGVSSQAVLGNSLDGITVQRSTSTVIDDGNVFQGNLVDGIDLLSATNSTVDANTSRGNKADGIRVEENSKGNTIGGTVPNSGNVIVGNTGGAGVEVRTGSTANSIQGNLIGLDVNGALDGNALGVYLNNVSENTVGGPSLDSGANTITSNVLDGIYVSGNAQGTTLGNTIENNLVGTGADGNSPGAFLPTNDVGVFVINSVDNAILGNVVSGSHQAGIELFGNLSSGNVLAGNIVGSNRARTAPILVDGQLYTNAYAPTNRQQDGILIAGAPGNMVGPFGPFGGNTILGNQTGIDVTGGTAIDNIIAANEVGPMADLNVADAAANYPLVANATPANFDGLANFFGIYIDNTTNTSVISNTIDRNISVGLTISGPAATGNIVQGNHIDSTGGYSATDGTSGAVFLLSYQDAVSRAAAGGYAFIFGSGIFINAGTNNTIGSDPTAVNVDQRNFLTDNKQVGIYVFNDGTTGSNFIRSNVITGEDHFPPTAPFNGDYGILLYNSSGDLIDPTKPNGSGVARDGTFANTSLTPNSNRIADFREFTGAVTVEPNTLAPGGTTSPTTASTSTPPPAKSSTKVKIKALSTASSTVNVNTGGKGHPLPPAMKSAKPKA